MSILPDRLLRLMDPKDRAQLGRAGATAAEASAKGAARLEREDQSDIEQFCHGRGWLPYRQSPNKKTTGEPGWPDFTIPLPGGVTAYIECKVRPNKPSPDQERVIANLRANGHLVRVTYSAQEAIDWLISLTT